MIIHTNQTSKRKPQNTAKRRADAKSWDALMKKYGVTNPPKPVEDVYKPKPLNHRQTQHIASKDTRQGVAAAAEVKEYTGSEMIGIGQLHKSNAVPVFRQSDAESLAKMRR